MRKAAPIEVPQTDEITQPGIDQKTLTPIPGSLRAPTPTPNPAQPEARGAILGIGMGQIGSTSSASGEISKKIPPGAACSCPARTA